MQWEDILCQVFIQVNSIFSFCTTVSFLHALFILLQLLHVSDGNKLLSTSQRGAWFFFADGLGFWRSSMHFIIPNKNILVFNSKSDHVIYFINNLREHVLTKNAPRSILQRIAFFLFFPLQKLNIFAKKEVGPLLAACRGPLQSGRAGSGGSQLYATFPCLRFLAKIFSIRKKKKKKKTLQNRASTVFLFELFLSLMRIYSIWYGLKQLKLLIKNDVT